MPELNSSPGAPFRCSWVLFVLAHRWGARVAICKLTDVVYTSVQCALLHGSAEQLPLGASWYSGIFGTLSLSVAASLRYGLRVAVSSRITAECLGACPLRKKRSFLLLLYAFSVCCCQS